MKGIRGVLNDWKFAILASLTLGLAPFFPEPHIWGKLKWVAGGAQGMALIDWFDLVMHGAPWVLLLRLIALKGWAFLMQLREHAGRGESG